uniref:Uncharacterized protein n=1 Tax=Anguilla anguilla TaxID=7936 RepID=A0A0E9QKS0_ANGAN
MFCIINNTQTEPLASLQKYSAFVKTRSVFFK